MAHIIDTNPKRRVSARLATGVAISTLLVLATTFAAPAGADEHRGGHWDNRGRGYYPPPPVVYGTPYYAPPPVVYGPTVGIALPGVIIGIQ
jgi:hypothetical protein